MDFLLGEDPTIEKCVDSKEAKIKYLLTENESLKAQISDYRSLLQSRYLQNTSAGGNNVSLLLNSLNSGGQEFKLGEEPNDSNLNFWLEENRKLQEMLDAAQNAREEEAARV